MDATKENCQRALDNLHTQERFMNKYAYDLIEDFLNAALRRLPSENAVAADRGRRRGKKKREEPT